MSKPAVNWQPLSTLPLIASMIDGMLEDAEQQYATLVQCRPTPHLLDDATVDRVNQVYSEQAEFLGLYEEQFARWSKLVLSQAQREEVNRLTTELPLLSTRIAAILALAKELKHGTIEAVLAKSDLELGLEALFSKNKP